MLIPSPSIILSSSSFNCIVHPFLSSATSEAVLTNHSYSHSSAPNLCLYLSIGTPSHKTLAVALLRLRSRTRVFTKQACSQCPVSFYQHPHTTTPPTSAKLPSDYLDQFCSCSNTLPEVSKQFREAASQTSCLRNTMSRPRPVVRAMRKFIMSLVVVCSHFNCQATMVAWSLT